MPDIEMIADKADVTVFDTITAHIKFVQHAIVAGYVIKTVM